MSVSQHRNYAKLRHRDLRRQLLEAYGNKCFCCGESRPVFLTLDHIANNGASERRRINGQNSGCSNGEWLSLKKRGWPKDGYRLLCYNCNCGRHRNWQNPGICPHEEERGEFLSVPLKEAIKKEVAKQLELLK